MEVLSKTLGGLIEVNDCARDANLSSDPDSITPPNSAQGGTDSSHELVQTATGKRSRKRRRKRMLTGVSRQRRAANERERQRIQGVNRAFVDLKNSLPVSHMDISKIDILRVAANWIDHLTELLNQDDQARTTRDRELGTGQSFGIFREDCFTSTLPADLMDDFLHLEDSWPPNNGLCVHTEEPYLQTLLIGTGAFTSDFFDSLNLTDNL